MAAIIMPGNILSPSQLVSCLVADFPAYKFLAGNFFGWSADTAIITYVPQQNSYFAACLLHELSHAELNHRTYRRDIELIRQESAAWDYAQRYLSEQYSVSINAAYIQDCLESYRLWLYQRSLCPNCKQTGLQTKRKTYSCINCRSSWRVNDARQCALRRHLV